MMVKRRVGSMCFFALATASQLDGCYHVFVDAGANIGIHTRFLFEPSKFPRSSFRKVFDKYFGADRDPICPGHSGCQ